MTEGDHFARKPKGTPDPRSGESEMDILLAGSEHPIRKYHRRFLSELLGMYIPLLHFVMAPEDVLDMAVHAGDSVSLTARKPPLATCHECAPACAWCCRLPVAVTCPEALWLARFIRDTWRKEEIARLLSRLRDTVTHLTGRSASEQAQLRRSCTLLENGLCRAYDARPLGCRGWNSFSKLDCEQTLEADPSKPSVPVNAFALYAGRAAQEAIGTALSQTGRDGGRYELHSALLRALEMPDALAKFIDGGRVFEGCVPRGGYGKVLLRIGD